jgi:hypothetical protein
VGTPFMMINLYNDRPLFSESFRKTFLTNYWRIETGQAYQVWDCKHEFK